MSTKALVETMERALPGLGWADAGASRVVATVGDLEIAVGPGRYMGVACVRVVHGEGITMIDSYGDDPVDIVCRAVIKVQVMVTSGDLPVNLRDSCRLFTEASRAGAAALNRKVYGGGQ